VQVADAAGAPKVGEKQAGVDVVSEGDDFSEHEEYEGDDDYGIDHYASDEGGGGEGDDGEGEAVY
tara:strand:+ start:477 stop:671 length:195 start_codon:yes stop_codon:yes gene_type:complete